VRHGVGRHGRAWRAPSVLGAVVVIVFGSLLGVGLVHTAGTGAVEPRAAQEPAPRGGLDVRSLGARLRVAGATAEAAAPLHWATPAGFAAEAGAAAELAVAPLAPAVAETALVPPPLAELGPGPAAMAASSGGPPPVHLAPTRYGDVTPSGGTWALLIGIDDYPGLRYDLRSAVNDVHDVDEALRRMGVTNDRRMLLRNGQATGGVIRAALDWLSAHAGPDATIVLFFAGHVQKLAPGTEALVGADGDVVQDVEVEALLDRSPAARSWIGIAACYAAGFDELVRPGRILTAAASSSSLAYESSTFGRSYLVEYMVRRAMLGARITTVEAAFARASEELRRDHPDRVPLQFDQVEGDLDLHRPPSAPDPAPGPADGSPPPPSSPPPSSPPPPSSDDGCASLTVGIVRCEDG
jgi:hypothetical protein